jgi:CheY-like chemotaxis protein
VDRRKRQQNGRERATTTSSAFAWPNLIAIHALLIEGLSFMRRMRQLPPERGGQVPAIAITAYYEDFAAAAALEAGFTTAP